VSERESPGFAIRRRSMRILRMPHTIVGIARSRCGFVVSICSISLSGTPTVFIQGSS
jgi:hypothetical protein